MITRVLFWCAYESKTVNCVCVESLCLDCPLPELESLLNLCCAITDVSKACWEQHTPGRHLCKLIQNTLHLSTSANIWPETDLRTTPAIINERKDPLSASERQTESNILNMTGIQYNSTGMFHSLSVWSEYDSNIYGFS